MPMADDGPSRPGPFPATSALPGSVSAAQLASITDSIAAQRRSIEALNTQLSAILSSDS